MSPLLIILLVFAATGTIGYFAPISRRAMVGTGVAVAAGMGANAAGALTQEDIKQRQGEIRHSDDEWRKILTASQYNVLRKEGTEMPGSSPLNNEKRKGTWRCAGCNTPLFTTDTKFNSGTGWPSFYQALPDAVTEVPDNSIFFMPRVEVRCKKCQGHLGHVFEDGPAPTGLRYCMNGVALEFEPSA